MSNNIDKIILELKTSDEEPISVFNRYVDNSGIKMTFEEAMATIDSLDVLMKGEPMLLNKVKAIIEGRNAT